MNSLSKNLRMNETKKHVKISYIEYKYKYSFNYIFLKKNLFNAFASYIFFFKIW